MAIVVNTNVSSLTAQRNLVSTGSLQARSLQRLSSGLRINSAKDDAAGLAISDRMNAQVRGLNQAARNANDGISLAQTAEGALQESTNILQRMRELAVQAANDTNTAGDRVNIQKEVTQLQSELNRIADSTSFNGKVLLDGSFTAQKFHIGSEASQTISVSMSSARATDMGSNAVSAITHVGTALAAAADVSLGNNVAAQDLTVNGAASSGALTVDADDAASDIAALVNGASGTTGVSATASNSVVIDGLSLAGTVGFTLGSSNSGGTVGTALAVSAAITTSDYTNLAQAINDVSASTGITATLAADSASITLSNTTGDDIDILNFTHSGDNAETIDVGAVSLTGPTAGVAAGTDSIVVGGTVEFSSASSFVVATSAGTTVLSAATVNSSLSSVADVDVTTQDGSNDALGVIDNALSSVAATRADLGAVQNRFESTIANLMSVSENISAARSRILDADFAAETANLTKSQILQQAGLAMLSQANQVPQAALTLLQG